MKKITLTICLQFAFLFFLTAPAFFSCRHKDEMQTSKNAEIKEAEIENEEESEEEKEERENDMYDEAAAAQQFEFERTKDPLLGYVPKERLITAYNYTEQSKQLATRSRTTSGTWIERGPTGDVVGVTNGNKRYGGGASISSGRIRAVWVDLNDASGNTVWVGGVDGGLWKTTDFKTAPATWVPVNDFFTNLSISSICQNPVNKNIMYFCTGEAYLNFDAVRGSGVFKSTDNGATWTQLASTSTYTNCSKILCDAAGNIYLGTSSSGLVRSTAASGGNAWTTITPSGLTTSIADFEISSTGRFHLSVGLGTTSSGGYRFTDNPSTVAAGTWTSATTPFPFSSGAKCRVELACSGNILYALPGNTAGAVTNIYKSTNGGVSWAATATSPSNTGNYGFSSNQAWYCLSADINPADANNVIIGSLNCYGTTDGGATWTQLSDWSSNYTGASTGNYVHADQHLIKWYANDEVLISSDGGIFYSPDAGVSFEDRNTGLNIKQFFSCDYHPTNGDYFLAGAQDNGCHQFSTPGLNTTTEILGGDGAIVHIDQNEPGYQFGSYTNNRYRRSTNDWSSTSSAGISSVNFYRSGSTASPVDFGSFINPTDYDDAANIMYCGSDAGEFFRWTTAQTTAGGSYFFTGTGTPFPTGANIIAITTLGTGIVSAVTVSPYTSNRIYLGTNSSKIVRVDNANTIATNSAGTDISGSGFTAGSTISCIATGSTDNNLIATFSNYGISNVWISTTGGGSGGWTAIDGNLPDMPVRWAVFDPSSNTKAWIATETGVWSTTNINGASTVWTASPGFPTVRTDMIKYRALDQNLIAATHGRGLWTQSQASVLPVNPFVLRGKWNNNSVELNWDYSNNVNASFEIESSNNGAYFNKTGATQTNTSYTDNPANTDIYYRVKGKNIFGNVGYSNVIHLQKGVGTNDVSGVKVSPNPVKNNMKITFAASGTGIAHYQITGINGQVCWKKSEDISGAGEINREWNMQSLKPGTYIFTVIYNNKKLTQKFSKL